MTTIKQRMTALLMLAAFCVNVHAAKMGPWNLDELFKVPKWEETDKAAKEGMTGILYVCRQCRSRR